MKSERLPGLRLDELDEEQRKVFELIAGGPRSANRPSGNTIVDADGHLTGPFNAMLYSPQIGEAVQGVGAAMRFGSKMAPRLREIAVLETARSAKSNFEWNGHVRLGKEAGLVDDEIAAILAGTECSSFSKTEVLIRKVTNLLIEKNDLDDSTFATTVEAIGREQLVELVYLVGYYEMIGRALRIWRTPLREGALAPFTD